MYAMIEFSWASLIWRLEKRGIRYGPMRTASAISVGVALCSGGTIAPVTKPPRATT